MSLGSYLPKLKCRESTCSWATRMRFLLASRGWQRTVRRMPRGEYGVVGCQSSGEGHLSCGKRGTSCWYNFGAACLNFGAKCSNFGPKSQHPVLKGRGGGMSQKTVIFEDFSLFFRKYRTYWCCKCFIQVLNTYSLFDTSVQIVLTWFIPLFMFTPFCFPHPLYVCFFFKILFTKILWFTFCLCFGPEGIFLSQRGFLAIFCYLCSHTCICICITYIYKYTFVYMVYVAAYGNIGSKVSWNSLSTSSITHIRAYHGRRRSDFKWLRLPKFPTSFQWDPVTFRQVFMGFPNISDKFSRE